MELTQHERSIIIKSLLSIASLDVIYEGEIIKQQMIDLATKLKQEGPVDIDLRAVVNENNEGVFDECTTSILELFPEIKRDIFVP